MTNLTKPLSEEILNESINKVEAHFQVEIFNKHPSDSSVIRFHEILKNKELKKVCEDLLKINPSSDLLIGYLEKLRLHDAVMPLAQIDIYDVPSNATQRNAFKKVAKSCQDALDAFATISKEKVIEVDGKPQKIKVLQSGFELLELAINRAIKASVIEPNSGFTDFYATQTRLEEVQQSLNMIGIIELLQQAANTAAKAPKIPLPTKLNARRPDIVDLATHLSAYVRMHYKKPLHQIVATTVNVALNLHDKAISADWVRKVARP